MAIFKRNNKLLHNFWIRLPHSMKEGFEDRYGSWNGLPNDHERLVRMGSFIEGLKEQRKYQQIQELIDTRFNQVEQRYGDILRELGYEMKNAVRNIEEMVNNKSYK